ncbi:NADPH-dependent oxidoreductase, partial [Mesorhizobium sp. M7A.F.Ca.AU.001.01.1.1]
YWVGEAMEDVNYVDLPATPEKVSGAIEMAASNAAHLAGLLKDQGYSGVSG